MGNGPSVIQLIKQSRPINLCLIAIAQFILFIGLNKNNIAVPLNQAKEFIFIACVLSTLLFTLGGYLINDFFDYENDKLIAKKNRHLSRSQLLSYYSLSLITNFILCLFTCHYLENYPLLIFFLIITTALYSYSSYFKKNKIAGNILVSVLSAASLSIIIIATELANVSISNELIEIAIFFMLFIFSLTMAREITKDCEDLEGDKNFQINSIPIIYGLDNTKLIINLFHFILASITLLYIYKYWQNYLLGSKVISFVIVVTIGIVIYLITIVDNKHGFKQISNIQKGIFGLGIILLAFELSIL